MTSNYFDLAVSLVGLMANLLALEAVVRGKFSLAGYRRFLISLLLSDLCICTVNILLFVLQTVSEYENMDGEAYKCLAEVGRSLEIISLTANLLNLCGMSVDHFIGIVYPLKYRYISHGIYAKVAVFVIWALSFIIGFADYPLRILAYTNRIPVENPGQAYINGLNNNCTIETSRQINASVVSTVAIKAASTSNTTTSFINDVSNDDFRLDLFSISELNSIFTSVLNSSLADDPCVNMSEIAELQRQHHPDVDEAYKPMSWCAYFDGSYKVWLEVIVMSLSLISLMFLSACYGRVFRAAAVKADKSKQKMRKLVLTTILLLGTFTLCWIPFVLYEGIMILILRWARTSMSSSSAETFFIAHNVLHSLCITCSPLLVPIIYAARIRVVQQRFAERYGSLVPASWKRALGSISASTRHSPSQTEITYLCRQRSSGSVEEMLFKSNEKIVGERLHYYHGICEKREISTAFIKNGKATRTRSVKDFSRADSLNDLHALTKLPSAPPTLHKKRLSQPNTSRCNNFQ